MGRRGPLPKSAELKSLIGAERRKPKETLLGVPRSQLQQIKALGALPPPPSWISHSARAMAEYLEVGAVLIEAGLLTRANVQLFCLGCAALAGILDDLEPPRTKAAASKSRALNQSLLIQYRYILSEFGLTPTSQVRRGGSELPKAADAPANPFESNKKQAA